MSHAIKVSDNVYQRLQRLQGPRESYSEVIDRCICAVEAIRGVSNILGPSHYLKERPKEDRDSLREATLERADLASRRLKEEVK